MAYSTHADNTYLVLWLMVRAQEKRRRQKAKSGNTFKKSPL